MHVTEFDNSADFLAHGAAILARNEAATGLIYGVADRVGRVADTPDGDEPAFLASVDDGSDAVLLAVMTPPHRIILHGASDAPDEEALGRLIDHMRAARRSTPGSLGPCPYPETFARLWTSETNQRVVPGIGLTIYELRDVRYRGDAPGTYRRATEADGSLLQEWMNLFHVEVHGREPVGQELTSVARRLPQGDFRLWEDGGGPVAVAAVSRPTPNGLAINAVYTPPERRGRGYATACVAALCDEILASGRQFVTLFADEQNPTSNAIYQRIGFESFGRFLELDFE